jgi:hypothetical protein
MSGSARKWVVLSAAAVLAAGLGASSASAQSTADCYAQIKSPSQGGGVGLTGVVEGTSATYGNISVWVLTHRKGLSQWWPQNGGPVLSGGNWSAKVYYGTPKEAGQPFEIAVVPVDLQTSEGLAGWTERASVYSQYDGIPLPHPAKGCRYNIVDVQRGQ